MTLLFVYLDCTSENVFKNMSHGCASWLLSLQKMCHVVIFVIYLSGPYFQDVLYSPLSFLAFVFSTRFIPDIRVAVELEPVPGTLDIMWEYTRNGLPVHRKTPCIHTFTHNLMQLIHLPACFWRWKKLEETHIENMQISAGFKIRPTVNDTLCSSPGS